jgi:hypothetical protein
VRSAGWSWTFVVLALLSCQQPKQPLQPSYFTQRRAADAPATCRETIDCYAQCRPLVEECLLRCDQRSAEPEIQRARAVNNCGAQNGCNAERPCEEQYCAMQLQACPAPRFAPQ